jgi:hypothetical protein
MGVQAHAHTEPRRGLSLWAGPELLYALRLESVDGDTPGRVPRGSQSVYAPLDDQEGEAGDAGPDATFDYRSGVLVGANMGLDARLAERVWLGSEVALAFSLVQAGQLYVPQIGTLVMERSTTAMLRAGLILRVLL